ncbi:hypothetical protein A6E15_07640 [Natrinema saccharevitans]|uniref:Uncharacterized protein n=1 Tax=Natrinema saccharevitans TaxID=301967 RepID=A0A1S8AWF1_9EURY|nr:hypothetical protein [Natrinema saccharevitans]OLZ40869.1 hypothetical protein A6E15_07640 [Natrinema saccharevitans]
MNDARLVGGSVLCAFLLAGIVTVVTGSPALLGGTPIGIAIYLTVGVALPQYLLSRRRGSALRLGLASLTAAGAAFVLIAGVATGSPNAAWDIGLVGILFVVVLGTSIGADIRAFRDGYRSAAGE